MGICPIGGQSNLKAVETPVESVTPAHQDCVVVSLCDYPTFGCTELTMCIGEQLTILSDDGDFMTVRSTTTGRESYVPTNYTARVTDRWLFVGVSRCKASELLMQPNNPNGAFLIRASETNQGCFSLSVLCSANSACQDCVKHYRISQLQNGWVYISPGLTFPSLHQLVEHYSESADGLCSRLMRPCFIQGFDNVRESRTTPTIVRRPTINWKHITRSVIFKRKRTPSGHSLVSEGLREGIASYLQMTDHNGDCWDI